MIRALNSKTKMEWWCEEISDGELPVFDSEGNNASSSEKKNPPSIGETFVISEEGNHVLSVSKPRRRYVPFFPVTETVKKSPDAAISRIIQRVADYGAKLVSCCPREKIVKAVLVYKPPQFRAVPGSSNEIESIVGMAIFTKSLNTVTETLRNTIRQRIGLGGATAYRIAKDAGVAPEIVSRFVKGERGLSGETIDKLANSLGLALSQV